MADWTAKAKGHRKGQPDLELKCKDGDRTDIITIETQNPYGSNGLSIHRRNIFEFLHDVNVTSFTSNT